VVTLIAFELRLVVAWTEYFATKYSSKMCNTYFENDAGAKQSL
jgi:hypothetical protein